jgi:hypothetical protein
MIVKGSTKLKKIKQELIQMKNQEKELKGQLRF